MGDSGTKLPALPEGFGHAAEKLADTVRHVVGLSFTPNRLRAKAQAQADAEIILVEARAQVAEIEARTVDRLRKRKVRRQLNIESITLKAAQLPPPETLSEEPVNEDWTSRFFEECQDIGDEQMQQLWARLLAGEVARPGSFSPRTLTIVRDLTRTDAHLFSVLCNLIWNIPDIGVVPVIADPQAAELEPLGIGTGTLTHLTSIGLIEFNSISSYGSVPELTNVAPSYFGEQIRLSRDAPSTFDIGRVIFTAVGIELTKIIRGSPSDALKEHALSYWRGQGWARPAPSASA